MTRKQLDEAAAKALDHLTEGIKNGRLEPATALAMAFIKGSEYQRDVDDLEQAKEKS